MKNKKIFRTLTVLCAALILMGGFSVTAYAQTPEDTPPDTAAEPDTPPLTPETAYHRHHQKRQLLLYLGRPRRRGGKHRPFP